MTCAASPCLASCLCGLVCFPCLVFVHDPRLFSPLSRALLGNCTYLWMRGLLFDKPTLFPIFLDTVLVASPYARPVMLAPPLAPSNLPPPAPPLSFRLYKSHRCRAAASSTCWRLLSSTSLRRSAPLSSPLGGLLRSTSGSDAGPVPEPEAGRNSGVGAAKRVPAGVQRGGPGDRVVVGWAPQPFVVVFFVASDAAAGLSTPSASEPDAQAASRGRQHVTFCLHHWSYSPAPPQALCTNAHAHR